MSKNYTVLEAKFEAQKLAFGPYYFQVVIAMRKIGILSFINSHHYKGVLINDIVNKFNLSEYGVRILLEAAESSNVVEFIDKSSVRTTKIGYMLSEDPMTSVNINFMNDVCYNGAKHLTESILNEEPVGLKELGDWSTIYEGLSELPKQIKKSWFEFDHYYSDVSFPYALPIVFEDKPKYMYDLGGNTGKWSLACCKYDANVKIKILDLPGQIKTAKEIISNTEYPDRIDFFPIDLLDTSQKIPGGADVIWMSQFLDCFSKDEISSILSNVFQAADGDTKVYILETFIDNQRFEAAKYSLTATSLYFANVANGNSKMYSMDQMISLIKKSGFEVIDVVPLLGDSYHTLLKCKKNGS